MTGYYIRVGYNSGYNQTEVWEALKKHAKYLCDNHKLIADEAVRLNGVDVYHGVGQDFHTDVADVYDYAKSYKDCKDLIIRIEEKDDIDDCVISQSASGGGASRECKENLRRAFIRLIMNKLHQDGMEISVSVG